jgi:hypothetical protein
MEVAAAIDDWTKPLMSGRSSTFGRAFASGMADCVIESSVSTPKKRFSSWEGVRKKKPTALIAGTPMSVNVTLRMYGGFETIWQRRRTVPTTLSTATQIGTGTWSKSCMPRKNFMTSEMFSFFECSLPGGAKLCARGLCQGCCYFTITIRRRRKGPRSLSERDLVIDIVARLALVFRTLLLQDFVRLLAIFLLVFLAPVRVESVFAVALVDPLFLRVVVILRLVGESAHVQDAESVLADRKVFDLDVRRDR